MKTRTDIWKLRQAQLNAHSQVLIRMPSPSPNNAKAKEPSNEKATPKKAAAPSDSRDAIRTDFAIPPVFPKQNEKRRSTEPDEVEMAAIRQEALIYTRPFGGDEGRAM